MSESDALAEVSEFVKKHANGEKVAVIFDLDSTLFCVSTRTQAILRRLAREPEFVSRFARESEVLRDVEVLPTDWGVRSVLSRTRLESTIEFFDSVRRYWRRHFFSNDFLSHDTIYPSAVEYVTHLHELGADILYLTGRSRSLMQEGTHEALRRWGFPFFSESKLIMKPVEGETDGAYKVEALKELVHDYDHIWFFENEPVIIAKVREDLPQVRVVFVDSTHSGKGEAPNGVHRIGMSYIFKP